MEKKKKLFLQFLEDDRVLGNVSKALLATGIKRTTAYRWRKEDKEFSKEWDSRIEVADKFFVSLAEYKLRELVLKGNVRAIIYALKNQSPEQWNVKPFCQNCERQATA